MFDFFSVKKKEEPLKVQPPILLLKEEPFLTPSTLGYLMSISRQAVNKMRNKNNIDFEAVKVGDETAINKIYLSEAIETVRFDKDKYQNQAQHLDFVLKKLIQISQDTDPVSAQVRLKRLVAQCKKLKKQKK